MTVRVRQLPGAGVRLTLGDTPGTVGGWLAFGLRLDTADPEDWLRVAGTRVASLVLDAASARALVTTAGPVTREPTLSASSGLMKVTGAGAAPLATLRRTGTELSLWVSATVLSTPRAGDVVRRWLALGPGLAGVVSAVDLDGVPITPAPEAVTAAFPTLNARAGALAQARVREGALGPAEVATARFVSDRLLEFARQRRASGILSPDINLSEALLDAGYATAPTGGITSLRLSRFLSASDDEE